MQLGQTWQRSQAYGALHHCERFKVVQKLVWFTVAYRGDLVYSCQKLDVVYAVQLTSLMYKLLCDRNELVVGYLDVSPLLPCLFVLLFELFKLFELVRVRYAGFPNHPHGARRTRGRSVSPQPPGIYCTGVHAIPSSRHLQHVHQAIGHRVITPHIAIGVLMLMLMVSCVVHVQCLPQVNSL